MRKALLGAVLSKAPKAMSNVRKRDLINTNTTEMLIPPALSGLGANNILEQ
jgi:hypothetical protein